MELDQLIFQKAWRLYAKFTASDDPEVEARTVYLEPLKPRLTVLARALTSAPITIITAEKEGGYSGNNFLLPEKFFKGKNPEDNFSFYLFRVFYLSIQKKLGYNWKYNEEKLLEESRHKAAETSGEVLSVLFEEYPTLLSIYQTLKEADINLSRQSSQAEQAMLYGRWMREPEELQEKKITSSSSDLKAKKNDKENITTELKAKPSDEITTIEADKKAMEEYCLNHNFEKIETADEFDGVWRDTDGDDSLKDDEEALKELSLKVTLRIDDTAHSVYKAEFSRTGTERECESDISGKAYSYPEWNYKKNEYRINYCNVFHKQFDLTDAKTADHLLKANSNTIIRLKKAFASLKNKRETVKRLSDGEELDFDATIESFIDVFSGTSPSDKVYVSKRKTQKELGILFLVDTSLSTDSYVNDRKILNTEIESLLVFGQALNDLGFEFGIDTFNSHTRNHSNYTTIKGFTESWKQAKNKIPSINAEGYTRIGPALRHASFLMEKQPYEKKAIILLSDGKPNDYDRYEGKYGIDDVKKSLVEIRNKNIHSFALAIESDAKYYLPQMFGVNNFEIMSNVALLPSVFVKFIDRLKK